MDKKLDFKDKFVMSMNYLFGKGVASVLPLDNLEFSFSKRTGRLKSVMLGGKLLTTLRSDGSIAITIYCADLLIKYPLFHENCVVVENGPDSFISRGRSVFAKHVLSCGDRVKPTSDVAILDEKGKVIGVGKAILSAKMMMVFNRGVAVKVRESIKHATENRVNA